MESDFKLSSKNKAVQFAGEPKRAQPPSFAAVDTQKEAREIGSILTSSPLFHFVLQFLPGQSPLHSTRVTKCICNASRWPLHPLFKNTLLPLLAGSAL